MREWKIFELEPEQYQEVSLIFTEIQIHQSRHGLTVQDFLEKAHRSDPIFCLIPFLGTWSTLLDHSEEAPSEFF